MQVFVNVRENMGLAIIWVTPNELIHSTRVLLLSEQPHLMDLWVEKNNPNPFQL